MTKLPALYVSVWIAHGPQNTLQPVGTDFVDELLSTEESVNFSRFAPTLRSIFNLPDIEVVRLGAKCIGHIASLSWTNSSEFVDQLQDEALESLQNTERSPASVTRKRASLFLLREIAENAPALFPNYLDRCLTHVWVCTRGLVGGSGVHLCPEWACLYLACLNGTVQIWPIGIDE